MKPFYCWKTGTSSRNPRRPSKFFAAFLGFGPGCMPSSSFPGLFETWSTVLSPGIAISGWASRTLAVCLLRKNEPGLFRRSWLPFDHVVFYRPRPSILFAFYLNRLRKRSSSSKVPVVDQTVKDFEQGGKRLLIARGATAASGVTEIHVTSVQQCQSATHSSLRRDQAACAAQSRDGWSHRPIDCIGTTA
jgi:hypothetical protein